VSRYAVTRGFDNTRAAREKSVVEGEPAPTGEGGDRAEGTADNAPARLGIAARMWLFWLLVFGALLAAVSLFAFPPAIPVLAIAVLAVCVLMAPFALMTAKNKAKKADDGMPRNSRGEITDLGYLDREKKIPRTQRAVFFGTPQWEQYKRDKGLVPGRGPAGRERAPRG
jgi:hypothetical protein